MTATPRPISFRRPIARPLLLVAFVVGGLPACTAEGQVPFSDWKNVPQSQGPPLVLDLAKAAQASLVLAPLALAGEKPAIQFIAYDGRNGELRQMLVASFKPTDLDYLPCTPPANRAFVQWCETNFNKKIDRGECWDLPAKGIPAAPSRGCRGPRNLPGPPPRRRTRTATIELPGDPRSPR